MRLILISDPGERSTDQMIIAACAARGIPCVKLIPGSAAGLDLGAPGERRLFYRTGVSFAAITIEQLLFRPGDAALHDPFFYYANQPLMFERAGLPRPRTIYVPAGEREALDRQVEGIGGWPVVLKRPGTECGEGVSLVHDAETLAAALAASRVPHSIEAYVPHFRCWRAVVLGGRMIAATPRVAAATDFRTNGPGSSSIAFDSVPAALEEIATRAAAVLNLDFGGADIMEAADGSLTIAELNFPCNFAEQQQLTGTDIAGAIVDRLVALAGNSAPA